jgi:hypothetical protein
VTQFDIEVNVLESRCDFIVFWLSFVSNLYLFDCEFVVSAAVFAELSCQDCKTDFALHQICACNFNKDILCVKTDFCCLRVNDWGKREDLTIFVIENGVLFVTLQNRQELLHLHVSLENLKKLLSVHALSLLKSLKNDILRRDRLICDWRITCKLIQVMSTH